MKVETLQKQTYSWADSIAFIGKARPRGKKKRVVTIGDLHSGHKVGLTPPVYQLKERPEKTIRDHFHNKFAKIHSECWQYYARLMDSLQPIDILVVNGDCIDGRGERSGGTELLTTDRQEQCDMAIEAIRYAKANNIVISYGTGYHSGQLEDFENSIAEGVNARKIGSHEWIDVNGVIFDIKHKVGSSSIPHGRATSGLREAMWSTIWKDNDLTPGADIIIRSHVHFDLDDKSAGLPRLTILPALQAMGTKYGSRQCTGIVSFGLAYFDVYDNGDYDHKVITANIESQKATALKL